jgi:hypothetical protein
MNLSDTMRVYSNKILGQPGPSPSKAVQSVADDCWDMFGDFERKDIKKVLAEQPGRHPIDPKTMHDGARYKGK